MKATIKSAEFASGKTLTLETGLLAKQASGSVLVRQGDTTVLCTAVMSTDVRPGQSFFPLTVDYRERFAAGGKIPGGFIKREGRPTDKEILSSRLVDRSLRPLFPDGMRNEVQIICNVMSADPDVDADVLAGTGASAALMLSGAPFGGPIAQVRVGRIGGEYVVNPSISSLEDSDINLVVSGKLDSIVMVEGEMLEISEDEMLEALDAAHEAIKKLCKLQQDLVSEKGAAPAISFEPVVLPEGVVDLVRPMVEGKLKAHLTGEYAKETFYGGINDIKAAAVAELLGEGDDAKDDDRRWLHAQ